MPNAETDYLYETDGGQIVERPSDLRRANDLERAEYRNRILALRRQGFTHDRIAEIVTKGEDDKPPREISADGVRSQIRRYLETLRGEDEETVETLRLIDSERLEAMFRRLEMDARHQGDTPEDVDRRHKAMLAQLRILERRAKLHGLDAPQLHKLEGAVDHHLIAAPEHVKEVDDSFNRRHGGNVLELPAADVVG